MIWIQIILSSYQSFDLYRNYFRWVGLNLVSCILSASQTIWCGILAGYFSNMPHNSTIFVSYHYLFMILENIVWLSVVILIYIAEVDMIFLYQFCELVIHYYNIKNTSPSISLLYCIMACEKNNIKQYRFYLLSLLHYMFYVYVVIMWDWKLSTYQVNNLRTDTGMYTIILSDSLVNIFVHHVQEKINVRQL